MKPSDIYCEKILTWKLQVEIVKETPNILVFKHTHPYWETHIVAIPKQHIESLTKISQADIEIVNELMNVIAEVSSEIESTHGGCRVSTNIGSYQSSKHLHFYIHSGKRLRDEDGSLVDSPHTD